MSTIVAAVAVLVGAQAPAGAAPGTGPLLADALKDCGTFGRVYLHLADFRDQGADLSLAVSRATEYLNSRGQTGSHLPSKQHRAAVTRFARFVYERKDLTRESLYLRGLYSCALSRTVAGDGELDRAQAGLDQAVASCQQRHAGGRDVGALGDCVHAAAGLIAGGR